MTGFLFWIHWIPIGSPLAEIGWCFHSSNVFRQQQEDRSRPRAMILGPGRSPWFSQFENKVDLGFMFRFGGYLGLTSTYLATTNLGGFSRVHCFGGYLHVSPHLPTYPGRVWQPEGYVPCAPGILTNVEPHVFQRVTQKIKRGVSTIQLWLNYVEL